MPAFSGIPFGRDYQFSQEVAEALMPGLMSEVRRLMVQSPLLGGLADTQSTKKQTGSWDIIPIRFGPDQQLTQSPHLTVALEPGWVQIQVTLPNAAEKHYWERLNRCSEEEFIAALKEPARIVREMRQDLGYGQWEPRLWIRLEQRHFHAQVFEVLDGQLEFDVDCLALWDAEPRVKKVLAWLPALRSLIRSKASSNYQFQIQIRFPYGPGSRARSSMLPNALINTAEGFIPFLNLLSGNLGIQQPRGP